MGIKSLQGLDLTKAFRTQKASECTITALDPSGFEHSRNRKLNSAIPALENSRSHAFAVNGGAKRPPLTRRKSLDGSTNSITLPPLERSRTDLGSLLTANRRPKSPTPNHTMINKRDPNLLRTPDFRALLTTSAPIPNLLDPPPRTAERKTPPWKPLKLWRNEVTKEVPSRPPIALRSDWKAPPAEWDDRDQYIYGAKPVFYTNLKYANSKDFTINPEWLSEFMTVSTYSNAYRTCALRYGWCA
ncbi:uncharacterized protein LOC127836645 isoform X1 [Dreissena polymorpha]|uniref:Uncharacterized protein n=1 Tax=Dreissena polymorpha TaxID=45954 RepID=A0A9D4GCB7_DREPO|nr:uncharacterized protein LOC127836645 isoform X1 [Dreissena polymorpha]KAH3812816.1 hypothetical protein DPMN_141257 [Dreissena polymorpha]